MELRDIGCILKLSLSLEIPRGPRTGSSRGPCIARLSTEPVLAIHYVSPFRSVIRDLYGLLIFSQAGFMGNVAAEYGWISHPLFPVS